MRVLFVSQYADPALTGGNNNVYRQAKALKQDLGVDVEILTWPDSDGWSGPSPTLEAPNKYSHMNWAYKGLHYHVVKLPQLLLERVLKDSDWQEAVTIGCELLAKINPNIVH